MSKAVDRDPQRAKQKLVQAAGDYHGVFPTRGTAEGRNRRLSQAVNAAHKAKPPVPGDEIVRILDDAKATGQEIDSARYRMVGRLLKPKDSE